MYHKKITIEDNGCYFCAHDIKEVDYKNTQAFRPFISGYKKVLPRKRNHLCAKHQRRFAKAVKLSRIMALMPFTNK